MRSVLILSAAVAAVSLAACGTNAPHNDVLLFGTTTVIGVDVQPRPEQQTMNLTLGYRRQEAVWMPLLANGTSSRFSPGGLCAQRSALQCVTELKDDTGWAIILATVDECKDTVDTAEKADSCVAELRSRFPQHAVEPSNGFYQSEVAEGSGQSRTDAYSVFASFGANLKGSGLFNSNSGDAQASGAAGIAQFFATGVAAQELAGADRVNEALAVQPSAAARAEADLQRQRAENAEADNARLVQGLAQSSQLTEAEIRAALSAGESRAQDREVITAWARAVTDADFKALANNSECELSSALKTQMTAADDSTSARFDALDEVLEGPMTTENQNDIRVLANALRTGSCAPLAGEG